MLIRKLGTHKNLCRYDIHNYRVIHIISSSSLASSSINSIPYCLLHFKYNGRLTLTNRKSILKAREGLFFLSNLSVIFCVT